MKNQTTQTTQMTQIEINDAISLAFYNLSQLNQMVYDYWMCELYDNQGEMIVSEWNESTLKKMEDDVMQQMQVTE